VTGRRPREQGPHRRLRRGTDPGCCRRRYHSHDHRSLASGHGRIPRRGARTFVPV